MEDEVKTKTVGLAEAIFIVLLVSFEELAEVGILLVTLGAGIMVVEVMNVATGAALEMYMLLRGGVGIKRLIVQPLGMVFDGLLGTVLPIKTVSTMIGIWMINHPETVEQVAGPVGQIAGGGKKAVVTASRTAVTTGAKAAGSAAAQGANAARGSLDRQRMAMAERRPSIPDARIADKGVGQRSMANIGTARQRMADRKSAAGITGAERITRQELRVRMNEDNAPMQEAA